MPQQAPAGPHFTYGDYRRWQGDERWELIDGEAHAMSPAPSRLHQQVLTRLAAQIVTALEDGPCEVYVAPFDVRLPRGEEPDEEIDTVVQPDVSVICDPEKLDGRLPRGSGLGDRGPFPGHRGAGPGPQAAALRTPRRGCGSPRRADSRSRKSTRQRELWPPRCYREWRSPGPACSATEPQDGSGFRQPGRASSSPAVLPRDFADLTAGVSSPQALGGLSGSSGPGPQYTPRR